VSSSRLSRIVLLAVAGLLAVSGCSNHHTHGTSAPATKGGSTQTLKTTNGASTQVLARYTPFRSDGSLIAGLTIRRSRQGTCTDTGPVLPDTYVCTTHPGNVRVGQCYPKAGSSDLICVVSPMARKAVKFQATAVLPLPASSPPNASPTQLLLSDGSECGSVQAFGKQARLFFTQGPFGHDGSLPVSYECDGPVSAIFGPIDQATNLWTVKARRTVTQGPLLTRTFKRAWL
jgi:hypothetical protein